MSQRLVQYGLVPVLAGLVGAAGTAFVLSMEGAPEPSGPGEITLVEPLRQDVARLEQDALLLRRRLDDLESLAWSRPEVVEGRADAPRPLVDDEFLALRQKVDALTLALSGPSEAEGGAPFLDSVEAAVETLREREEQERDAERKAFMEQRLDERLAELATEIGLDTWQQGEMKTLFSASSEERGKIFENARTTGDFGGIRDAMRALDESTQGKLASIMTPSQLEQYHALGGMDAGFGPPGGRFFGGGFDGRRGGAPESGGPGAADGAQQGN